MKVYTVCKFIDPHIQSNKQYLKLSFDNTKKFDHFVFELTSFYNATNFSNVRHLNSFMLAWQYRIARKLEAVYWTHEVINKVEPKDPKARYIPSTIDAPLDFPVPSDP